MPRLDIDTVLGWRGRTVRDADGEKVGTFGDVFLDRETDHPAWGSVRTGLFGRRESFVPLSEVREEGDDLHVPYAADEVKGAPQVDPDVALTGEEERALYEHYGQEYGGGGGDVGDDRGGDAGAAGTGAVAAGERRPAEGEPDVRHEDDDVDDEVRGD